MRNDSIYTTADRSCKNLCTINRRVDATSAPDPSDQPSIYTLKLEKVHPIHSIAQARSQITNQPTNPATNRITASQAQPSHTHPKPPASRTNKTPQPPPSRTSSTHPTAPSSSPPPINEIRRPPPLACTANCPSAGGFEGPEK